MYEKNWKRKHDSYTPVNMHEIVSWYEMLMFKVRIQESRELNYVMPVNPPIRFNGTCLYMKPMEQLYIYDLVQTLMFPRVLHSETDDEITDVNERNERIGMAYEDKPWFQFHADLDTIRFYGKERIHNFMENLVMQMEVPY